MRLGRQGQSVVPVSTPRTFLSAKPDPASGPALPGLYGDFVDLLALIPRLRADDDDQQHDAGDHSDREYQRNIDFLFERHNRALEVLERQRIRQPRIAHRPHRIVRRLADHKRQENPADAQQHRQMLRPDQAAPGADMPLSSCGATSQKISNQQNTSIQTAQKPKRVRIPLHMPRKQARNGIRKCPNSRMITTGEKSFG